jgi:hypothetical protein
MPPQIVPAAPEILSLRAKGALPIALAQDDLQDNVACA